MKTRNRTQAAHTKVFFFNLKQGGRCRENACAFSKQNKNSNYFAKINHRSKRVITRMRRFRRLSNQSSEIMIVNNKNKKQFYINMLFSFWRKTRFYSKVIKVKNKTVFHSELSAVETKFNKQAGSDRNREG